MASISSSGAIVYAFGQPVTDFLLDEDGFQFLNIEQPLQIKSAANRRLIRRCATLSRNKNKARSPTARPSDSCNAEEAHHKLRLQGMIASGSTGPFRAFPVEMEIYMYQLFDYMKQSLSYRLFPYKSTAGFHPGQVMLRFAVLDARVLHSILSITSFAIAKGNNTFLVWGLKHRGRTIQLVNKSLLDRVDECPEAAVLAVAQMGSLEVVREDCDAWKSHMRGLRQILQMHGGLGIYPTLWYNVTEVDFMGSYMFDYTPFLSNNDYQPVSTGKINLDTCYDSTMRSVKSPRIAARSKLNLLPETHVLSEELNSILAEMHVINQYFQPYYGQPYSYNHIHDMLNSRRAVEFRLFNVPHDDSCNVQHAYKLALQIYINIVFRTFKRGEKLLTNLATRLHLVLMKIDVAEIEHWEYIESLLLWISTMGGASCASGALRTWYINFARHIRQSLGLKMWEDVNAVLKERLYSYGELAESFYIFWNEEGGDFAFEIEDEIVESELAGLGIDEFIDDWI